MGRYKLLRNNEEIVLFGKKFTVRCAITNFNDVKKAIGYFLYPEESRSRIDNIHFLENKISNSLEKLAESLFSYKHVNGCEGEFPFCKSLKDLSLLVNTIKKIESSQVVKKKNNKKDKKEITPPEECSKKQVILDENIIGMNTALYSTEIKANPKYQVMEVGGYFYPQIKVRFFNLLKFKFEYKFENMDKKFGELIDAFCFIRNHEKEQEEKRKKEKVTIYEYHG